MAVQLGFIEVPAVGSPHETPIPLGGGIAIFLGFVLGNVFLSSILAFSEARAAIGIFAGTFLIFLIGIYDDALEMGPLPKIMGQAVAAIVFLSFTQDPPPVITYPVYLVLGTVWIVGIQNALNFLDNTDGLCAGVAMTAAIGMGILFVLKDMSIYAFMSFALAGGALGFLRYNLPPASIFLGATGSMMFGFALSCLALVYVNSSRGVTAALSPLIILAYPIVDLTFVTIGRLNEGRKVYIGGRRRSSEQVGIPVLSRRSTVLTIYLINMLLVVFGIVLYFISGTQYRALLIVIIAFVLAFAGTHLYKNFLFLKYRISYLATDFIAVNLALLAYLLVRRIMGDVPTVVPGPWTNVLVPLAWISIYWVVLYAAGGLYDLQFETRLKDHLVSISRLVISGAVIFAVVNFNPARGFQVSMAWLLQFSACLLIISSVARAILFLGIGRKLSTGVATVDAILYRTAASSRNGNLTAFKTHYNVVGYAGLRADCDLDYLGGTSSLEIILRDRRIGRVILDIPDDCYDDLTDVFNSAFFMDTRFLTDSPGNDNFVGLRKSPTRIPGVYIISPPYRKIFVRIIRRLFDFIISSVSILILSPFFAFKLLFPRSKYVGRAETIAVKGLGQKEIKVKCPQRGSSGRFCGWHGLIAVFKGDFSLVGPSISKQPASPAVKGEWRRFLAKPGIFGPGYETDNIEERFAQDLKYLEKSSLIYDILILLKQTVRTNSMNINGLTNA
jgi:UDP-GlcNAc:undecaprenyl-phosphate GlcNAc-1-phosphate transferase